MSKMIPVLVGLFSVAALSLTGAKAEAGCIADTTLESSTVNVTPESECFSVEVVGAECVPGLDITLTNNCEFDVEAKREGVDAITIAPGEIAMDNAEYVSGEASNVTYAVTIGEESLEVEIDFVATDDGSEYEGCSVAGGNRSAPLLLLIAFVVSRARRRSTYGHSPSDITP